MTLPEIELNAKQFKKVRKIVLRFSGIDLKEGKEALVRARLMKRMRALQMASLDAYLRYIESYEGAGELGDMIDAMTTNKTGFFREMEHFNFLREKILPEIRGSKMRFWSAACSSGEEPFSMAITLRENILDIDFKDCLILATDISNSMLEKAAKAIYSQTSVRDLQATVVRKYFNKLDDGPNPTFQVNDHVRRLVRLAWLNLMGPWPMKGPFNVVFCRNTMIYFDRAAQEKLIQRFWDILKPGGYLFVGHSEGLLGMSHKFVFVRPATYRK
jgi:chemotaxis protein methyltransferase CheR